MPKNKFILNALGFCPKFAFPGINPNALQCAECVFNFGKYICLKYCHTLPVDHDVCDNVDHYVLYECEYVYKEE